LIRLLKHKNFLINSNACRALGELKSNKAVGPLIDFLKEGKDFLSVITGAHAIEALAKIKPDNGADLITELFADSNYFVSLKATFAYQEITSKNVVEHMFELLNKDGLSNRTKMAEMIGKPRSGNIIDFSIDLLKINDPIIRRNAAELLGKVKSEKAAKPLIGLLRDDNLFVYRTAADALANINPGKTIAALIALLKNEGGVVKLSVPFALRAMALKLETPTLESAVGPLISLLDDENPGVRKLAAEALGEIKSDRAAKPLIKLLGDSKVCVSAAEALKSLKSGEVVRDLIKILGEKEPSVREMAAYVLGEMESHKAVEPLIELFNDRHESVCESAVKALGKISTSLNSSENDKLMETLYILSGKRSFRRKRAIKASVEAIEKIKNAAGRRFISIERPYSRHSKDEL
jgi:HEAT repeat protein